MFNFFSLINFCVGTFILGFILYGTLWASWIWVAISFLILRKFATIISSNIFMPFPFVFFFWDTYDLNVGVLSIVPEASETGGSSFLLIVESAPSG